jgi:general secretion pathway protein G
MMAVVLPNLIGTQKTAYIKNTRVQIGAIEEAADFYALDHDGTHPATIEDLVVSQGNDPKWKGPYLKSSTQIPADSWGTPIQYVFPSQEDPSRPEIRSMGPDRQPNTADDITNFSQNL